MTDDWVLVPREPTQAMVEAIKAWCDDDNKTDGDLHQMILAAAPKPPVEPWGWATVEPVSNDASEGFFTDVVMGAERPDYGQYPLYAHPPVSIPTNATHAITTVAVDANWPPAQSEVGQCRSHYLGCACHEAKRDAEIARLREQIERMQDALAQIITGEQSGRRWAAVNKIARAALQVDGCA